MEYDMDKINLTHLNTINKKLGFKTSKLIRTVNGSRYQVLAIRLKKSRDMQETTFGLEARDSSEFNEILRAVLLGIKLAREGDEKYLPYIKDCEDEE